MADPFQAFSGGFSNLLDGVETLFGSSTSGTSQGTASSESTATLVAEDRDRLEISDEAIDEIVRDILAGPDGLANIFSGENVAGVFNSSVANQAAGDLTARITGEIAKLRAERVQTRNQEQTQNVEQKQRTDTKNKKKGLLNKVFGF